MSSQGFVTEIIIPPGNGRNVFLVSLIPNEVGVANYGRPVAIYSDNTIRDESGAVVNANAGLRQGSAEWISGRQPNGQPWPVKGTDTRDTGTTGGIAPGEKANADPLFIRGVLPPEPVYDDARNGGWGTPITEGGPPSSISRRDDRWVWPDGRITDAQGTVLGRTSNPAQAARELYDRGVTPSIQWIAEPVVASPAAPSPGSMVTTVGPNGATQTVTGTGRVVASAPPGGFNVNTLVSPAVPAPAGWAGTEEASGSPAPVYIVKPGTPGVNSTRVDGAPNTDSSPGTEFGTAVAPVSGIAVDGPPSDVGMAANGMAKVPTWAVYLGAAVAAYMLLGRR